MEERVEVLKRLLGVGLLLVGVVALALPFLAAAQAQEAPLIFEDADVHEVIKKVSELTGITFLFDPEQVKGKITILSPKNVSSEGVLQLLQSALALHGYTLLRKEGVAQIVPTEQAPYVAAETIEVIELKYARAEELASTLAAIAPHGVRIVPYHPTNSLIISGRPAAVEELIGIIKGKEEESAGESD
jgi:type II secretory pathway component GspD/PulD (secretin)